MVCELHHSLYVRNNPVKYSQVLQIYVTIQVVPALIAAEIQGSFCGGESRDLDFTGPGTLISQVGPGTLGFIDGSRDLGRSQSQHS